jgi:hypothetical protein
MVSCLENTARLQQNTQTKALAGVKSCEVYFISCWLRTGDELTNYSSRGVV